MSLKILEWLEDVWFDTRRLLMRLQEVGRLGGMLARLGWSGASECCSVNYTPEGRTGSMLPLFKVVLSVGSHSRRLLSWLASWMIVMAGSTCLMPGACVGLLGIVK